MSSTSRTSRKPFSCLILASLTVALIATAVAFPEVGCIQEPRGTAKIYRHTTITSNKNNEPASNKPPSKADSGIYLENLDDLEHVAYLAMRNFNITDESLLQWSWNLGSNKQHQKVVVASSTASVSGGTMETNKDRLALMLESFILHLRNGHLRQLKLDELREIVGAIDGQLSKAMINDNNSTTVINDDSLSDASEQQKGSAANGVNETIITQQETKQVTTVASESLSQLSSVQIDNGLHYNGNQILEGFEEESYERCSYLVDLYVIEIKARQQQQQQQQQQDTGREQINKGSNKPGSSASTSVPASSDRLRLLKLCRLVVRCHSADELVGVLGGPWRGGIDLYENDDTSGAKVKWSNGSSSGQVGSGDSGVGGEPTYDDYLTSSDSTSGSFTGGRLSNQPRSLRDSLSQSLAKLCPLMLFQLHDEDGMCSFRKDDRPPMVTVWGFATLFVTIVSFVSLIGLSITPLLGPGANRGDQSSASSSNFELSAAGLMEMRQTAPTAGHHGMPTTMSGANKSPSSYHQQSHHQHRACLTLFEGLAVGSLVGSALFSLIPQAFELQERESNQGFLLKALIIFFGIYLFFCSERIMRIILDTRQHRKRKRRGSNSIAPPSATVDNLVGFATPTTGCSGLQQQQQQPIHLKRQSRQRSSSIKDQHQVGTVQDVTARVSGDSNKKSIRPSASQAPSFWIESGKQDNKWQIAGKRVNFPAAQRSIEQLQRPANQTTTPRVGDEIHHRRRLRRRERIKSPGGGGSDAQSAAKSATTRSERRQAAKRHQSRTRRSTTAAGRRQKRKTRYQLLVQSKRLHNDTLALPSREGAVTVSQLADKAIQAVGQEEPHAPLYDRRGSQSSTNSDAASYNLPSSLSHDSASLAEESYDSTTSLGSSSSDTDSDDTDYRLGFNQRAATRQQQYNIQGGQARRLASNFNGQIGESSTSSPFYLQQAAGQISETDEMMMVASQKRPNSTANAYSQPNEKQEISTVAWMIVLGDGLHNFIDGISIGAAFSESILSGVSISVAVICEEFPHELGDFAVLVLSGMTVRQALGYNFLSACTCYLGMAVGIILGDVNDGASYISALAAGVFLYIALVDMMGELSASLEESSRDSIGKTLKLLLLQNVGIFIGISIILVLSFIDF